MNAEQRPSSAFQAAQTQRVGLHRAMGSAEEALAAPAVGRADAWAARVSAALGTLQGAFEAHVEITEGPDGILEEIVRLSPRLANPVSHLRRDHTDLRQVLSELVASVGTSVVSPDSPWVNERRVLTIPWQEFYSSGH